MQGCVLDDYSIKNDVQQLYKEYNIMSLNEKLYKKFVNVYKCVKNEITAENIREVYNELFTKYYHNEAVIKAAFIRQILFKSNNSITIFELNSGESRLDLCKVNGKSVAYEIKTELDTLDRLDKQVNDYQRLFDEVYVICPISKCQEVEKVIPLECGIYVYEEINDKLIFKVYKNVQKSEKIDVEYQLSTITLEFLRKVVKDNSLTRGECIEICKKKYKKSTINTLYKRYLKIKYSDRWNFLKDNNEKILDIDYQWFFKNNISPTCIYK